MKRTIKFFSVLVLSAVVFSVSAQYEQNSLREVTERNTYGDNWFVSIGGNANLLAAEQDSEISALDRIKFGGQLTVGKWFNPNFGFRLQGNYGSLRGFNYKEYRGGKYVHNNYTHRDYPIGYDQGHNNPWHKFTTVKDKKGLEGFWQDFDYATVTVDLMANFTNLLRGRYAERNLFDFIPFAGLGWVHAVRNDLTNPNFNHIVAKIGMRVNFNVTNSFAIYLEPQANAADQEFDGYRGTALGDGFLSLGLGLQYTFNKGFTNLDQVVRLTADEIDRLNRKINDNRYLIENHQNILERQQNLIDRLDKCCEENKSREVITTQYVGSNYLPDYVRFGLDSYRIEPTELRKLAEIAQYLKTSSTNSKLLVVGYADRKTGNPSYNLRLSQRRVEAVAAELKRLGINENRIVIEWKGDQEQPFPQNEWNRVVVLVERQ